MRLLRRIRQFLTAGVRPTPADLQFAREILPPPLYALFASQTPRDIVHGVRTARRVRELGYDDPALLMAALLHDIGKGRQRRLDRVAYVVATWFGAAHLLASPSSRLELRRAVARSCTHAEAGARLAAEAGAPPRVVALIRRHHGPARGDAMLAVLQRADDES